MTRDNEAGDFGYTHPAYIASLAHIGTPLRLSSSGGWVLTRSIPGTDLRDCTGPYPLFLCTDWSVLTDDLGALARSGAVSVTVVPDPFGDYSADLMASTFDVVREIKRRSIVDLSGDFESAISSHHRTRASRALERIRVDRLGAPHDWAQSWADCYVDLAERRGFTGPAAFPAASLKAHAAVPGMRAYHATLDGTTLGYSLWIVDGTDAYGHLAAYTDAGRDAGVAYAFYAWILRDLRQSGVCRVDLGAGLQEDDGLARWKQGWTRDSVPSFVCGRVLRPAEYADLTRRLGGAGATPYFPGYRAPDRHHSAVVSR